MSAGTGYWPAGLPRRLEYPDVTVGELPGLLAGAYGSRTAIVDGDRAWSFEEFALRVRRCSRALAARGVRAGDVILLHLPNCGDYPVVYYGALLAGASVSLSNPLTPAPGITGQLDDGAIALAVTHPAHVEPLRRGASGTALRRILLVAPSHAAPDPGPGEGDRHGTEDAGDGAHGAPVVESLEAALADADPEAPLEASVDSESVANVAYTGGTTGRPKGVRVLHRNVVANITQMVGWRAGHAVTVAPHAGARDGRRLDLTPFPGVDDAPTPVGAGAVIVVSPLFHAYGLAHLGFQLACGATAVIQPRFSPDGLLDEIERHAATYVSGSPTMWRTLAAEVESGRRRDLGSVTLVSSGAAPIDPGTLGRLAEVFPNAVVMEGYGLTEGTCLVTSSPALRGARRRLGSVGPPVFDTEITVHDLADVERILGPGEDGEVWVRGPQVTGGYLNAPDATAAQFVDGWLRTGDVGHLDDDGFLVIADRAKDVLLHKGYNVYPRELEDVLTSHPDIAEAAVVGRPDPDVGDVPIAVVTARAGVRVDAEAVMAHVAARVVPYKRVRDIIVVDTLPTSAAGKILKNRLREDVTKRPPGAHEGHPPR